MMIPSLFWRTLLLFFLGLFPDPSSGAETQLPFFLRVESREPPRVLLQIPVQPGDLFYFHYMHSSDKTPVRDTFKVNEKGEIILIEEAFLWYGAGLEFQGHQDVRVCYEGPWTKVHLNRVFIHLPIRVGGVSQQNLIIRDRFIRLDTMAQPGECLILSVAR